MVPYKVNGTWVDLDHVQAMSWVGPDHFGGAHLTLASRDNPLLVEPVSRETFERLLEAWKGTT